MRIAVLSDIHGNYYALKSVLEDINTRDVDQIFDLGDSLYGPIAPGAAYSLIREAGIISISGNQDRFIYESQETENATLSQVKHELKDTDALDWLKSLPFSRVINEKIYICHGSPADDSEYLMENIRFGKLVQKTADELDEKLAEIKQQIVLCGHSHTPGIVKTGKKIVINPGSIGLPAYSDDLPAVHIVKNTNSNARYCILDIKDSLNIEQIDISYDSDQAAQKAAINNRPDWAKWLRTGSAD